jgi:hypothetical protein
VNGGHCLLPWLRVCMPVQLGGLGVLNLKFFGTAMRCRWPWLKWAAASKPWTLLLADVQELFHAATRVRIGNGKRAKLWTDRWLPNGSSIQHTVPILFSFVRDSGITVDEALRNMTWTRDITRGISMPAMAQYLQLWHLISNTTLTDGQPDELTWCRAADGAFSVKSAYEMFFNANSRFACAKPIWKSKAPMK